MNAEWQNRNQFAHHLSYVNIQILMWIGADIDGWTFFFHMFAKNNKMSPYPPLWTLMWSDDDFTSLDDGSDRDPSFSLPITFVTFFLIAWILLWMYNVNPKELMTNPVLLNATATANGFNIFGLESSLHP